MDIGSAEYRLKALVFTIYKDEIRSAKIDRIVIDDTGINYLLRIDGEVVERTKNQIHANKEGLFNHMVNRFTARQQK